jgi:hypothetical protein
MAFANFKPEIWSESVLMARDRKIIAVQNSWRQFEGDIKAKGDRVHIVGLTGATIKDVPVSGIIDDPEVITDDGMELVIDQRKYINFKVDDIDKLQSNVQVRGSITSKTGNFYAVRQDSFVYNLAVALAGAGGLYVDGYTVTTDKTNILAVLSNAIAMVQSNDGDGTFMEVHPYVFQLLQQAITAIQMPNDSLIQNGLKGMLWDNKVFMSANIPVTTDAVGLTAAVPGATGAIYHCLVRTQEAIAFAEQKAIGFESYRMEKGFSDGIKGFGLYGAKIVRPSELVDVKIKIK